MASGDELTLSVDLGVTCGRCGMPAVDLMSAHATGAAGRGGPMKIEAESTCLDCLRETNGFNPGLSFPDPVEDDGPTMAEAAARIVALVILAMIAGGAFLAVALR